VLTLPDFAADAPAFEVWCDASGYGIGAVLMQAGKVIAYEARSPISAERNYTTGEQELLAVVHALRTWRCYLEGKKEVKIMTDHVSNTYLPTQATLSRRLARWSEFLQRLPTLSWHYKPGKINVADPVSRAANLLTDCAAAPAGLQPVCDARRQRDGTVPVAEAGPGAH
jgi:RNase H-like domain found in reverse transcriptase